MTWRLRNLPLQPNNCLTYNVDNGAWHLLGFRITRWQALTALRSMRHLLVFVWPPEARMSKQ